MVGDVDTKGVKHNSGDIINTHEARVRNPYGGREHATICWHVWARDDGGRGVFSIRTVSTLRDPGRRRSAVPNTLLSPGPGHTAPTTHDPDTPPAAAAAATSESARAPPGHVAVAAASLFRNDKNVTESFRPSVGRRRIYNTHEGLPAPQYGATSYTECA